MSEWIARLTWPGVEGAVVLGHDLQFRPEGGGDGRPLLDMAAAQAGLRAVGHVFGPDKGEPGHALARQVALELGARLQLAPVPPLTPGVVY
jgi:hypothetical protein